MQGRGSLVEYGLRTLLEQARDERSTGTLTVRGNDGREAILYFLFGHLFNAVGQGQIGDDAVLEALGWAQGTFEMDAKSKLPADETVRSSISELIARSTGSQPGASREPAGEAAAPSAIARPGPADQDIARALDEAFVAAVDSVIGLDDIQDSLARSPLDVTVLRRVLLEERSGIESDVAAEQQTWLEASRVAKQPPNLSEGERVRSTWVVAPGLLSMLASAVAVLVGAIQLLIGYVGGIFSAALQSHRLSGWEALGVALVAFALFMGCYGLDRSLARRQNNRKLGDMKAALHQRVLVAQRSWLDTLRQAVRSRAVTRINESFTPSYDLELTVKKASGLTELYDDAYRVSTAAVDRLSELVEQLPGGNIGLAGPRGAGKTMLIRKYCPEAFSTAEASDNLTFMVSAPVEYAARDFLYYLFAALCRSYLAYRGEDPAQGPRLIPAARPQLPRLSWGRRKPADGPVEPAGLISRARRYQESLRFLQTHTAGLQAKASLGPIEPTWQAATASAEQPLIYPEMVAEFRSFLKAIAQEVQQGGGTVVIGIDELDKIGSGDQAQRFLNELKVIFSIPHCYFLVAVSEDALMDFEMRGLPVRTAFESTFDEIIPVSYLPMDQSRELLRSRVVGLSEPFLYFCHCLAGGLPRDLIRTSRHVISVGRGRRASSAASLPDICRLLVAEEIKAKAQAVRASLVGLHLDLTTSAVLNRARTIAAGGLDPNSLAALCDELGGRASRWGADGATGTRSGSVSAVMLEFLTYLYFCTTLVEFFDDRLTEEKVRQASDPSLDGGHFDVLASARQAMAVDPHLAWLTIHDFRRHWGLRLLDFPDDGAA